MNQKLIWAATGLMLMGITGIVMVTAEPSQSPALIAGDQPVTEDQVRQKLQSDGWSNVQIVREGRYIEAIGAKNGRLWWMTSLATYHAMPAATAHCAIGNADIRSLRPRAFSCRRSFFPRRIQTRSRFR